MQKRLVFLIIFLMILIGCTKKTNNEDFLLAYPEYIEIFARASYPFADEETIISAIKYIDQIIEKEAVRKGGNRDTYIYYDKARLLYKLKRYDEALDTLYKQDDNIYYLYRAALLIILEHNDEANMYLQKCIDTQKEGLLKSKEQTDERNLYIQQLVIFYILADEPHESIESILNELMTECIITQQDAEILLQEEFFKNDIQQAKEIYLTGMWLN